MRHRVLVSLLSVLALALAAAAEPHLAQDNHKSPAWIKKYHAPSIANSRERCVHRFMEPSSQRLPPPPPDYSDYHEELDTAAVSFLNNITSRDILTEVISVFYVYDNCRRCLPQQVPFTWAFKYLPTLLWPVNSQHGIQFVFTLADNVTHIGKLHYKFNEHGIYTVVVGGEYPWSFQATVRVDEPGISNIYRPLYVATAVLFGLVLAWVIVTNTWLKDYLSTLVAKVMQFLRRFDYDRGLVHDHNSRKSRRKHRRRPSTSSYGSIDETKSLDEGTPLSQSYRYDYNSPTVHPTTPRDTFPSFEHNSLYSSMADLNLGPSYRGDAKHEMATQPVSAGATKRVRVERFSSVDAFRGIALMLVIFVDYGGGGYYFFTYSTWNGLTVADVVFPLFVSVMGTCMALSFNALHRSGAPVSAVIFKVFRRSAILFALGIMVVNYLRQTKYLRIMGVLQRLSLCYFSIGSIMLLSLRGKHERVSRLIAVADLSEDESDDDYLLQSRTSGVVSKMASFANRYCPDIANHLLEWLLVACLVVLHLCLTLYLYVPGCGAGYVGPGGIGDLGLYRDCPGGAAGYIDRQVFGPTHLYDSVTSSPLRNVYQTTVPFEPYGILGTLSCAFLTYLGVENGRIMIYYRSTAKRVARWAAWSIALFTTGFVLSNGGTDEGSIPINRNLWSFSYVCITGGISAALLATLYLVIDHFHLWRGIPFTYMGMNSIVIYFGSLVLKYYFPFTLSPVTVDDITHASLLTQHVLAVLYWLLVAFYLNYRGIIVKI